MLTGILLEETEKESKLPLVIHVASYSVLSFLPLLHKDARWAAMWQLGACLDNNEPLYILEWAF